jgi:NAD(P)H-dependent FMN reductase
MVSIVGLSGSLRKASFNSALLRAAAGLTPPDLQINIQSIAGVPVYDADVEEKGIPDRVKVLKDSLAAAKALLLVTPEYNNSLPGVLKNAIDWMSRPSDDIARVFRDKPVALLGASNGMGGTRFSQTAWLPVFRTLGMRPWFGSVMYLGPADNYFDKEGNLTDEKFKERLRKFLEGFKTFVETQYR